VPALVLPAPQVQLQQVQAQIRFRDVKAYITLAQVVLWFQESAPLDTAAMVRAEQYALLARSPRQVNQLVAHAQQEHTLRIQGLRHVHQVAQVIM
jgi:hypothetical protein